MSRLHSVVVLAASFAVAVPASAQGTRLRPQLSDARLWQVAPDFHGAVALASGIRQPSSPSLWSKAFVVEYLAGGFAGMELLEAATPPLAARALAPGMVPGRLDLLRSVGAGDGSGGALGPAFARRRRRGRSSGAVGWAA